METSPGVPPNYSKADARAALDDAASARTGFAHDLRLPPGYSLLTGTGNAAFTFGVALGNSEWRFATVAFVLGLACQLTAAAIAVRLFQRVNGAWVNGLGGPRATWPMIAPFLAVLIPCIVVSTWLMVEGHGVVSLLVALTLVPLTAIADRWWMARFRAGV